jgi:hypothetical protein
VPLFAKRDRKVSSYGVAQVDLSEGPRVEAIPLGGSDDFRIGMEVELDLETLGEDAEGNEVVIFRFRPAGSAGHAGGAGRAAGRDQIDSTILPAAYFALWAQRRMHDYGTKPAHFAAIAAKNWNHGALCPWSDRRPDHRVTPDEVLASQMVAEPLTAMMACPADDGAACAVVASVDRVRARQDGRRLVRPVASVSAAAACAR